MKQVEEIESKQEVVERRIKILEEAGYTRGYISGIATIAGVIDACHLIACDMVLNYTDVLDPDPKTASGYVLTYTQMLFSRMQIVPPQPSKESMALMQGMRMPRLHPDQN